MSCVIGNYEFRLGPDSVNLPYDVNVVKQNTIGGKVFQVLGVTYGDLTVSGSFGSWEEQSTFLETMKDYAKRQSDIINPPEPFRFVYTERDWDFMVTLKRIATQGGSHSVRWANDEIAPVWRITMFIDQDNGELTKIATDAFIERLSKGVGWKRTEFSAPQNSGWNDRLSTQEGLRNPPPHIGDG